MILRKAWIQPIADLEKATDTLDELETLAREEESRPFGERVRKRILAPKKVRDRKIAEAYEAGAPVALIARTAGISKNTITKIVDQEADL